MNESHFHRNCPVCQDSNAVEVLQKKGVRLVQCSACKMIYANPLPPEIYRGEIYSKSASYYLSQDKLESDFSDRRFERELKLFRRFCVKGDVLDVGCSTGGFLAQLQKRHPGCYSTVGMDAVPASLNIAKSKGVSVIQGDFLRHDFGKKRFDAITFWAVIEHLVDPQFFIQRAAELLKPNGLCFVLVPNMKSLAVRLLGARYRYILPEHVNYFTETTLTRLMEPFEVIATRYTHFNPLVILQDLRSPSNEGVSQEARGQLLKQTIRYKQRLWLKPAKWGYDLFEQCLAQMKLTDNLAIALRKRSIQDHSKVIPMVV